MEVEDWRRLADRFDRAIADPEQAARIVAELEAEDPALGRELAELLAEAEGAVEATGDPLAGIVGRASEWLSRGPEGAALSGLAEGAAGSVGPYRLIRELGRGGLGTVYLATREEEGFPLEVALKMVDRRFASRRDRERLIEERRILATLNHPNIARVFDAGTAADGTPYFVLERIEGEPIDAHCDRLKLLVEQRIELFLGVCDAVAYAHRRLVIHRDIKPSNILVSAEGVPKLLDFGLAKVLDDDREGLTQAGERLLTPEYASPEQLSGEALTTATDLYSLGALLFVLLTGRPVFALRGLSAAEMERQVCRVPPPEASVVAGETAPSADGTEGRSERAAALRGTTPARLSRRLRGDLDTILAKALRKEPHRRYTSVEQLAEDLRRHRAGRPIAARGDSGVYRAGRFVRRHRVPVAAAGLVLLALVGGLISTVRQMRRARLEQARTEQVASFLVGLFEAVDPNVARGTEPSAREILDRGGRDLLAGRNSGLQPEVQATLAGTIGRVYRQLGHYAEAERLLTRALELRRQREGPVEVARALVDLGQLHDDRGDYEAAARELLRALALESESLPADAPERATTLYRLASVEVGRGRVGEAERRLGEALAIRRKAFGERSLPVAEVRHARAQILYRTGRLKEAEAELSDVLTLRRAELGEDHPASLTVLNDLASVRFDRGDAAGALALLERTVALREKVLGIDHPFVATALLNLATVARQGDDLPLARRAAERAFSIYRKAFGPEHAQVAEALSLLAKVDFAAGALKDAERRARQALDIQRRRLDPKDLEIARTSLQLAAVLRARGAAREAESLLRDGLTIQEATLEPGDPALSFALLPLGELLAERGETGEALRHLRRALAIREAAFPAGHRRIEEARVALARCLNASRPSSARRSPNP